MICTSGYKALHRSQLMLSAACVNVNWINCTIYTVSSHHLCKKQLVKSAASFLI